MHKQVRIWLALLTLLTVLTSCGAAPAFKTAESPRSAPAPQSADSGMAPAAAAGGVTAPEAANAPGLSQDTADALKADAQRMIVRTDDLSLVVADAGPALQSITELAGSLGGYIAASNAWREGEQLRARVTVRVPSDKLDAALAGIKKLAVRVERENLSGQDVTEEYTDLNAQLTNLEATELELRELMTEVRQKTQKAEDVLQIYRELEKTRSDIERIKGRMQYLSQMTSLATLNIDLIPDVLARPVVEPGWRPLETARNAGRQLVIALQGLASATIWLAIYVLPLLILLALPIVLLVLFVRWLIRRNHRPRPAGNVTA